MRENRTHGSEGGESGSTGLPYPYQKLELGTSIWVDAQSPHQACIVLAKTRSRTLIEWVAVNRPFWHLSA